MDNLNLIPCEICNILVDFNRYIDHSEECYIRNSIATRNANNFNNNLNTSTTTILNNNHNENQSHILIDIELTHQFRDLHILENDFINNSRIEELNGGDVCVPVQHIAEAYDIIDDFQTNMCIICLDHNKDVIHVRTKCNHHFCKVCIDTWFNMKHKCPICQYDFNEQ